MVSDARSNCCFTLNIYDHCGVWKPAVSFDQLTASVQDQTTTALHGRAFLSGPSVFAGGFIYTCSDGGLASRELIEHCDSHYSSVKIRNCLAV